MTFEICLDDRRVIKRHVDHIRPKYDHGVSETQTEMTPDDIQLPLVIPMQNHNVPAPRMEQPSVPTPAVDPSSPTTETAVESLAPTAPQARAPSQLQQPETTTPRRSARQAKAPQRYGWE